MSKSEREREEKAVALVWKSLNLLHHDRLGFLFLVPESKGGMG